MEADKKGKKGRVSKSLIPDSNDTTINESTITGTPPYQAQQRHVYVGDNQQAQCWKD
jgi:hypothetical protein